MTLIERISTDHLPDASGVYRVVCDVTGECYVGSSVSLIKRGYNHVTLLANRDHYSRPMQLAYNEHGSKAFRFEVLDLCDLAELSPRETAWIERLEPAFNTHEKSGMIRPLGKGRPPRRHALPKRPKREKPVRFTHVERRARRLQIAQAADAGESVADLSKRFGVSEETVRNAIRSGGYSPPRRVGRPEDPAAGLRRERVKELFARPGMTATAAARELGAKLHAVCGDCRAMGIQLKRGCPRGTVTKGSRHMFVPRQVWESVDWTKQNCEIARELLVSDERVRQVRKMLGRERSPKHRRRTQSAEATETAHK